MWIFSFRGPKIFPSQRFLFRIGSHGFTARKPTTQQSTSKNFKNPRSFTNLIKAILLKQVISSFHMSSFKHGQHRHGVPMTGLSIDSKLPIVAYATAFDHFAMCCQLLLLSIILGILVLHLKIAENISKNEWEIRG